MTTVYVDCGQFKNLLKRGTVKGIKVNETDEPLENALDSLIQTARSSHKIMQSWLPSLIPRTNSVLKKRLSAAILSVKLQLLRDMF